MLHAPDLIFAEAGNIIWKKHRLKELTRFEAEEIAEAIVSLPLKIETSKALLNKLHTQNIFEPCYNYKKAI